MGAAQLRICGGLCWSESHPQRGQDHSRRTEPAEARPAGAGCKPEASTDWVQPPGDCADGFGGKASICPPPEVKARSGPITLEALQGQWQSGNGSQITVTGTCVYMNSVLLQGQSVELGEDGRVRGIGQRLQVDGWTESGGVQFRANSASGNYMEFAPKEVWEPMLSEQSRDERLRLLGYAGTAASYKAGTRGVEGCIPGTLCQLMPDSKDALDVGLLQALISQWREPDLCKVCSVRVVPDFVNREGTGVGVELVHYIARSICGVGFRKRQGKAGHEVPVVVREPPDAESRREAVRVWRERVAEEDGFPPVLVAEGEEMFTSLGNGHFFQALNLYRGECPMINDSGNYCIGGDEDLREAITAGVLSIVMKPATPRPVRAKIAMLLNAKREFKWTLGDDGSLDICDVEEDVAYCPQFEAMSKHLDAVVVNSLVRTHLGVTDSKRMQG